MRVHAISMHDGCIVMDHYIITHQSVKPHYKYAQRNYHKPCSFKPIGWIEKITNLDFNSWGQGQRERTDKFRGITLRYYLVFLKRKPRARRKPTNFKKTEDLDQVFSNSHHWLITTTMHSKMRLLESKLSCLCNNICKTLVANWVAPSIRACHAREGKQISTFSRKLCTLIHDHVKETTTRSRESCSRWIE